MAERFAPAKFSALHRRFLRPFRDGFSRRLVGYSNADVEAVILMANDDAAREGATNVSAERFVSAAADYFPSRDSELLEDAVVGNRR